MATNRNQEDGMRGSASVKGAINLRIIHPAKNMMVHRRDPKTGNPDRKPRSISLWRVRRETLRVIERFGWPCKPIALNVTVNGYKCRLTQWGTDRTAKFEVIS